MTSAGRIRTILGIKLKHLRTGRGLTLAALSERAGISVSYLAEIEGGRKTPKPAKVIALAEALGVTYDELASTRLEGEFGNLSALLDSPALREFPFERFGLPAGELLQLLSRSPTEVTALLRALSDIARQHNIGLEHFLHAALRSYQVITGNFYPELEQEAEAFVAELGEEPPGPAFDRALRQWIEHQLGTTIDETALTKRTPLRHLRSALVENGRARLLINPALTASQRAFVLAREAGYRRLALRERCLTSPPDREDSFDQVLNDFRASYFAGAVLLPRARLVPDIRRMFRRPKWEPGTLLELLDRYDATPETMMYRLSQLLPGEFGLKVHFLKFRDDEGSYRLVKQLNLSDLPIPPGHGGGEHYCRRWLTTRLLGEYETSQPRRPQRRASRPITGVQLSRFVDGDVEYCCLGLALPTPLRPDVTTSLTLGFRVDDAFRDMVRFARDRSIPRAEISTTCERCPLEPAACGDRVAKPSIFKAARARESQQRALDALALTLADG